jgi:hypothetical protein
MTDPPGFIPPHGNYQKLLSYQKAEVIYDVTFRFCQRFLHAGDRTIDQMVQSARSGKQNIAEGSKASLTSKEFETRSCTLLFKIPWYGTLSGIRSGGTRHRESTTTVSEIPSMIAL